MSERERHDLVHLLQPLREADAARLARLRAVATRADPFVACVDRCHQCCPDDAQALALALDDLRPGDLGGDG